LIEPPLRRHAALAESRLGPAFEVHDMRIQQFTALLARAAACCAIAALCAGSVSQPALAASKKPENWIRHILVINLENESFGTTFGPNSPATYLNGSLLKQGELIPNWYATGHVSLDNYIAQISGQGSTRSTNSDCIDASQFSTGDFRGKYFNVTPGNDDSDSTSFPGQVDGDGCIFPSPTAKAGRTPASHGASTIGDQLDEKEHQLAFRAGGIDYRPGPILWRQYSEDMGNTPARDNGDADPFGGTDCGHPLLNGVDNTNSATPADQYATRHNGFMYFHSVIDNQQRCDAHVVPLGGVSVGAAPGGSDIFTGHLFTDLKNEKTTPRFMFVTPNLCDDGHDATCAGLNTEGGNAGGLKGADLWLKHWMPMILNAPAYRSGRLLVVLTFDEGGLTDSSACNHALSTDTGICNYPTGPNISNFGFSPILSVFGLQTAPATTGVYPGGGQIGAVLFNSRFIAPGSVNATGQYNHFSALRSYEDLLHIDTGGDDGKGHLGYAAEPGLEGTTFGADVFNK
jgi:phosphatidylinositol-3-phosphatase